MKGAGSVYITLKVSDARAIATLSLEKLNKIVLRVNDTTDPANVILQGDLVGTIADAAPIINALVKIVDSLADVSSLFRLVYTLIYLKVGASLFETCLEYHVFVLQSESLCELYT